MNKNQCFGSGSFCPDLDRTFFQVRQIVKNMKSKNGRIRIRVFKVRIRIGEKTRIHPDPKQCFYVAEKSRQILRRSQTQVHDEYFVISCDWFNRERFQEEGLTFQLIFPQIPGSGRRPELTASGLSYLDQRVSFFSNNILRKLKNRFTISCLKPFGFLGATFLACFGRQECVCFLAVL